jgi:Protein of unknown function (DUF2721)
VNIQTAGKTIQLILAPVVMVTACGVLLNGMLSHYAAINDRIRTLVGERLGLTLLTPPRTASPMPRNGLPKSTTRSRRCSVVTDKSTTPSC